MITYSEAKREANIKNHGFDFVGSETVFAGFTITREDERDAYGEMRLQTLGLWHGMVVFVVHTPILLDLSSPTVRPELVEGC